jgi:hypothetical protein
MIFGGYGRKSKVRGEVFFPCTRCDTLNAFGLVENYGYGQLYGVRVAKYKTNRAMLCSHCQDGYGLTKEQWAEAIAMSDSLKGRLDSMSASAMAASAVQLSRRIFPELTEDVRELLAEQLDEMPRALPRPTAALPEPILRETPALLRATDSKSCTDCGESVRTAARKCRFCGYRFDSDHTGG